MCNFLNENMIRITYDQVRRAQGDRHFTMSLTSPKEIQATMTAVNQGIDSYLEACFIPDFGDVYKHGERKTAKGQIVTRTLECKISQQSMPVLLRRLFTLPDNEASEYLASRMLDSIGIDEYGKRKGA